MNHTLIRLTLRWWLMAVIVASSIVAARPSRSAFAAILNVATFGADNSSCGSSAAPCRHIQYAIDNRAGPGDTIVIAPGTYIENINIVKSLTLQGSGAAVTFVDGAGLDSVVKIGSESAGIHVNLSGLTFQNGQGGTAGGGISNSNSNGVLTISNCNIIENSANYGGGIRSQGQLIMTNVVLHGNTGSQNGGGIYSVGFTSLTGVTIYGNTAQNGGGISNAGTMTVTNSVIGSGNQAGQGGGIYNLFASAKLTLNNTTVNSNQATAGAGGGIYNQGTLIAASSTITGNQASGGGGGIYSTSTGQLTLNAGSIQNNRANSSSGGGLDNEGAAALNELTVMKNSAQGGGGGIYNGPSAQLTFGDGSIQANTAQTAFGGGLLNLGAVFLSDVNVTNNEATLLGGGGIENSSTARLTVSGGSLSGNRANSLGGGLDNTATADLARVTISNNRGGSGGGAFNGNSGRLTLGLSTILSNTAVTSYGGGVSNQGALTVTQSSIVNNTASSLQGGGLYNKANAKLTNVTISNNTSQASFRSGGAIYNDGGTVSATHATISQNSSPAVVNNTDTITLATVSLINTIVAFSTGGSVNCDGVMTSLGNNLDSGNTCGFTGGSFTNTDPLLGPLADNGGGTLTRILFISSSAVDGAGGCPVAIDQRGVFRPQGDGCDIGAYEVIGFTTIGPVSIGGNQCVTSTAVINSGLAAGLLHVGVNLEFTPRSALAINLYAPARPPVNLLTAGTGDGAQNLDVLWNDGAVAGIITSTNHDINFPYYKYSHQPAHALSILSGIGLRGNWRLEICNTSASTGTLNRWTIVVANIQNFRVLMPLMFKKR
jgi:subtilisin-like proprotein convertase family protein